MIILPPKDVHYVDPRTGYQVRSFRPDRTEVLDPKGDVLWTARMFTGHDHLDLSPDGRHLVTSGGALHVSDDDLATVICEGVPVRRVWFSDCFAKSAQELAGERGIPVMGGGWVDRAAFVKLSVDWDQEQLRFELYTRTTKIFGFEPGSYRPTDSTEAALFEQVRSRPNDDGAREVYADWLEQHDLAARANLLRAEGSGIAGTDDRWRAVVSRVPVDRCTNDRCPKSWSALSVTRHDRVRSCIECRNNVYYCTTNNEILWRADGRDLIAIDAALDRRRALQVYQQRVLPTDEEVRQLLRSANKRPEPPVERNPGEWLDTLDLDD